MIDAWINGEPVRLEEGTHLRALVSERIGRVEGVAVACNDTVIPRPEWATTFVHNGDRIEMLTAVAGG